MRIIETTASIPTKYCTVTDKDRQMRYVGDPHSAFGGLYHCAIFGWNRCSSFDNMHVLREWSKHAHNKSNMADSRHIGKIENHRISETVWPIAMKLWRSDAV